VEPVVAPAALDHGVTGVLVPWLLANAVQFVRKRFFLAKQS
jgi:hypothetical protein